MTVRLRLLQDTPSRYIQKQSLGALQVRCSVAMGRGQSLLGTLEWNQAFLFTTRDPAFVFGACQLPTGSSNDCMPD